MVLNKVLKYMEKENQFYPTPQKVVADILSELRYRDGFQDLEEVNFLEPCAGDGAICKEIKKFFKGEEKKINIEVVEIEKVLRDSLKGQGYKVVGENFLEFENIAYYDLIVMNPPFNKGAKFLLKAYKLLNSNGNVICLLNAETIKNPCNKERKLLKNLIERTGEVKFIANAFEGAERKTETDIAVVYLNKPTYENEFNLFGDIQKNVITEEEKIREELKEKVEGSELMSFDKLDHSIGIYRNCVKQIFKGIDTIQGIKSSLSYLDKEAEEFNIKPEEFIKVILENEQEEAKDITIKMIRKMVWSYILKYCDMDKYLYSKHQQDFYDKLDKGSASLPFTKDNILQFFNNIFKRRVEYLKQGIIDLFETITSYHKGNREHKEGWKTNRNWKINKKIIVDWGVHFDKYKSFKPDGKDYGSFSSYDSGRGWMNDLDKIVRKLKPIQQPDSVVDGTFIKECLHRRFRILGDLEVGDKFDNEVETPYFTLKFWKKGTLHITFKDDNLLKDLNVLGAKLRTDLGYDDYGKK